ncbi:filament-like plant protein [Artemisia annua]|uniref:Filament-like plant protein n=1 Tax=Artemisia annua TaxID=35608 RepID=A0A2U1KUF1_ARTAN|nr:filament-like plant protein [Artemisia annua]
MYKIDVKRGSCSGLSVASSCRDDLNWPTSIDPQRHVPGLHLKHDHGEHGTVNNYSAGTIGFIASITRFQMNALIALRIKVEQPDSSNSLSQRNVSKDSNSIPGSLLFKQNRSIRYAYGQTSKDVPSTKHVNNKFNHPITKKLKASKDRLEEAVSVLAHQDSEIKASRNQIEEAESKLGERVKELNASRDRLEEAKCKSEERVNELKASRKQLKEVDSVLTKTRRRLKLAESQYKASEAERGILLQKIETLENNVQKEHNLLKKAEAKCQQLKDEVSRLQHEVQITKSANRPE